VQVLNSYLESVLVFEQDVSVRLGTDLREEAQDDSETETVSLYTLPHVTIGLIQDT
jgi:hypothetical protein